MSRAFESKVLSRDVTPEPVFFDRRRFLTALGLSGISIAAGPSLLAAPPKSPSFWASPTRTTTSSLQPETTASRSPTRSSAKT